MSHFNNISGQRHRTGPEDEGSSPDTKLSAASWFDYDWRSRVHTEQLKTENCMGLPEALHPKARPTWFGWTLNPSQIPTAAF